MKFSENLRKLRNDSGLTQKELGEKLGVVSTTVRNWENTKRQPSYEILIKLSEIFDVTVGQLLGSEELY